MSKSPYPECKPFHSFKCGEIFCIAPSVFNVTCSLCGDKMHMETFLSHNQLQHFSLTLAEECISIEELEGNHNVELAQDVALIDNTDNKCNDPEEDPIKQEDFSIEKYPRNSEDEVDIAMEENDKCLQQLIENKKKAKHKLPSQEPKKLNARRCKKSLQNESPTPKIVQLEDKTINSVAEAADSLSNDNVQNNKDVSKQIKQKEVASQFYCEICGRQYRLKQSLIKHIKSYHNPNKEMEKQETYMHKCDKCDQRFPSIRNLRIHQLEHTGVPCVLSVNNDDKEKTAETPQFNCEFCDHQFRCKQSLKRHNDLNHNQNKPKKKIQENYQHPCDKCDRKFRSERDLRAHYLQHTGIVCDICGLTFTQVGNLMRHKIRHTGIKDHKCKECPKEFYTERELKMHMISHTGVLTVICEICGKRCRDGGILTAHMRRHTGERPAKCEVCEKRFFSIHDLNLHAVIHSNLRPFKCDICEATFQRKKSLRIHKLIHTNDRKHVCSICGKSFTLSSVLKSHLRSHDTVMRCGNKKYETADGTDALENRSIETSTTAATEVVINMDGIQILSQYVV